MDPQNAFIGKTAQPTAREVAAALGPSITAGKELLDWLGEEQHVTGQEWNSFSPKYGWTLKMKLKRRTILHLSPCDQCFRVMFILSARAVEAARTSNLPKAVLKALDEAPRYPEGTGLRFVISEAKDLAAIRQLALVKLAN